jgi:hypothetical protein
VSDEVHASVDDVKAPRSDPVVDRIVAQASGPKLPAGDDAVLPLSKPGGWIHPVKHRTHRPGA